MKIDHFSVEVSTGIDLRNENNLQISSEHNSRNLSNGIKIKANSGKARFIQFVTHLVPDLYEISQNHTYKWDEPDSHYMPNPKTPKWRVDTATESCFYDDGGVHIRTENETSMYDCPGGLFLPQEEIMIFCTFVIIDSKVEFQVKWSKQYDMDQNVFFTVEKDECHCLPDWAIKTITEDYNISNKTSYDKKRLIYNDLPNNLRRQVDEKNIEKLNEEASSFLVKIPDNWITKVIYPKLFSDETIISRIEKTKEESFVNTQRLFKIESTNKKADNKDQDNSFPNKLE